MNPATPTIPRALQEKLDALDREIVLLHFKWIYLKQLFGTEKHLAVVNATAPSAFSVIEEALFNEILLSLMRLVDPVGSKHQMNLSLRSLLEDIPDEKLRDQVAALEKQIREKVTDIKTWRDKKLAHNDLLRLLKKSDPVPPIQIFELTAAMQLVRKAMNLIYQFFSQPHVLYDQCVTQKDGNDLIFYLNYGLECWREDREKRNFDRARRLRSKT